MALAIKYDPTLTVVKTEFAKRGIDAIAKRVSERLIAHAHDNWTSMISEDGWVSIDEDGLIQRELDLIITSGQIPSNFFSSVFEHPIITAAFEEMKVIIQDIADDAKEWNQASISMYGKLRYHGLSYKDFV